MAEIVSPIVAHTPGKGQLSPTTVIPKTEFPYPSRTASDKKGSPEPRTDSEATLHEQNIELQDHAVAEAQHSPRPTIQQQRPILANKKYGTEAPQPVSLRPPFMIERHSTGAKPNLDTPIKKEDLDSGWSDSEDGSNLQGQVDLTRQESLPGHDDLRHYELNRARMRPWRRKKKKNEDTEADEKDRGRLSFGNDQFHTHGRIAGDGRLNVKINDTADSGYLAKALGSALQSHLLPHQKQARDDAAQRRAYYVANKNKIKPPKMNICIMVIGSRGDIQPFLKIGRLLQDSYGHRVRIATHPAFKKFVEEEIGLDFFSIGGDPAELMGFMVKNPGLIPSFDTLTSGEVGRRRDAMFEMFNGFWRACVNTTDDEKDTANLKLLGNKQPFIADAIIANPVSFAPVHCAEKLNIPLHLVFTFPMTPTKEFPSPLANVKQSNVDREYTNYMSYPLVDLMQWQGLGDLINRFRVKTLGLEPVSTLWAPGQLTRLQVPMTYLWSPGLVPKPEDWGPEIDIAGYVFLDLAKSYKPPEDLTKFLKRSEGDDRPLIYIGFGSISGIDDARGFCQLIFDAVQQANVRAVVSRGWGGMGDGMDVPETVFMIDNVPHDWLFPQVDAVVHHGGAGTTAAGLKLGLPTMIVPFFGDQPFWAQMITRAGAGAKNVYPLKKLTVERFAQGITDCMQPEAKKAAQKIAKSIEAEGDGAENAIDSFHAQLNLSGPNSMRCSMFDDRVAVWKVRHTEMRLSALAAELLAQNKQIRWSDLDLVEHKKWIDFQGPGEPITGAGGVVVGAFQEAFHGLSTIDESVKADIQKIKRHHERKKSRRQSRRAERSGERRRRRSQKDETEVQEGEQAKVNLIGEAAPVKKPRPSDTGSDSETVDNRSAMTRPVQNRQDTSSTLNEPAPVMLVRDVGKGIGHSFKSIVLLPMEMLNAITLGFRNAPRLYGDQTVRPPPASIKGFRQGVRVAGEEFFFGVYDGATGLVQIPAMNYREEGPAGLPKGVARGVGGLVLKPVAGTLGLLNYTNKGAYAALRKLFRDTERTERWIRRARLAQGAAEVKELRERGAGTSKDSNPPRGNANRGGALEKARTQVLSRFNTNDRLLVEEARAKEEHGLKFTARMSRSDRGTGS